MEEQIKSFSNIIFLFIIYPYLYNVNERDMKTILLNKKNREAKELELRGIITACRNAVGKAHTADVNSLMSVVNEKKSELEYLQKNKEWLFNFDGGGWNSVVAKDKAEAKVVIRKQYGKDPVCIPNYKTIRLSTPSDKQNLLSGNGLIAGIERNTS